MEADVYTQVKASIKKKLNIDLSYYKDEQMKRRLDSWLVRAHVDSWNAYFTLITTNEVEFERFRNYLTINVTEFFRDPNRWETLGSEILPYLMKNLSETKSGNELKLWSAGCSIGTEAYSLAMLMAEIAPHQKFVIHASDIDHGALAKARAGGPYSIDDIRNLTSAQRQSYISPAAPYHVSEKLKKNIRFQEQNLLSDRFDSGLDLIICRNVVIYFTAEAKDTLYAKFRAALRPGGILFLGGTEIISGPAKFGLQPYGISFYKKG